jgi:cytochrome P450
MQPITEMDLPNLPVEAPAFCADPMPYVEAARRQHPWLAKFSAGYIVHGYQAHKDLLTQDDKLQPGLGGIVEFYGLQGTHWARFMEEMVVGQSGPTHTRLRASVAQAFTPRRANLARPLMRQVISELLDKWAPKGAFNFAEFAADFPIAVICGLLGVSTSAIPSIRSALELQITSLTLDPSKKPAFLAGHDALWNFTDRLVTDREQNSTGDDLLLDALIAAKTAGQLDETELRFMIMVLLVAGYDTSKNLLTLTIHMLLDHPEMWARCAEDKAYCALVIEEMLRHSTIATFYRSVEQDFVYDGVLFSKGTLIIFATPLAGRDPSAFPEPMVFDPERVQTNRHVAFGRGAHICLGMFIARAQLEEGLHLIAQRLTHPRLAGPIAWRLFLPAWGLRELPITFTAAPAALSEGTS